IEVYPDPGDRRNPFLQKLPDLTLDDAQAVRKGTTSIREFTPFYMANAQMKFGDARHTSQMYAVNSGYQEIVNHWVQHGRFFSVLDEESKKRVAVVGQDVADGLKLGREPIGKLIQVNDNAFAVIGIFEKKGGTFGNNQDDLVVIPFATATAIYGSENMRKLVLAFQMRQSADLDLTKEQV